MSTVKTRWVRWGVPLVLAVVAVWLVSTRGNQQKAEAPLPPTIDAEGDLYVGDRDQLWAFKPNGDVKWVVDLKQYGVEWGFMTVVLSRQRYVGGVTTDGKVLFFWSHNGELAMPALELPGGPGPAPEDEAPEFLWKDLMDPDLVPFLFNLIQGWELEVANTPALHPETGRLYITAAGATPDIGVLYGIDITDDALTIAFQAPMGGGSGTSPAISHDGKSVYAVDEFGRMIAIDAHTGKRLWQSNEGGGGSASPSIGPDETIYTPFQDGITAYTKDGQVRWEKSYSTLCKERLPEPGGVWNYVSPLPNGKVMITTSGAITSIFYYMVNRILPDRLKVAGPPKAGLLLLEPR